MTSTLIIRTAREADAKALLDIYRPFAESTSVSFELQAPSVHEFAARISKSLAWWHWLVAERDGECVGYAYGSPHREREAYAWSVEVSAYVRPTHLRQGIAQALYSRLFAELASKGYCNAYAGVTLPNPASIALHLSSGFSSIGVFKAVGRKFGAWQDVAWYHRVLRSEPLTEQRP